MNPDPFTLRQLKWMAEARGNFCWQQTSSLEALLINQNRDRHSRPVSPNDLNPFAPKTGRRGGNRVEGKAAWDMLRQLTENSRLQENTRTRKGGYGG